MKGENVNCITGHCVFLSIGPICYSRIINVKIFSKIDEQKDNINERVYGIFYTPRSVLTIPISRRVYKGCFGGDPPQFFLLKEGGGVLRFF